MPKFPFSLLSIAHGRWVRRGIWLIVLGCLSLSLSIGLPHGLAQANWSQRWYAQSQANVDDVREIVEAARHHYETEEYDKALEQWQKAASIFESQGDSLNQVMALSNLSLTQQALSQWSDARQSIDFAFELLKDRPEPTDTNEIKLLAQSRDVRGKLAFVIGDPEEALNDWQRSQQLYDKLNDDSGYISQLNQAQAYQVMGQYLQAQRRLEQVVKDVALSDDINDDLKISIGRTVAKIQRLLGNLSDAEKTLACLLNYESGEDYRPISFGGQRFRRNVTGKLDELSPICIHLSGTISDVEHAELLNDWGNLQVAIARRAQDLGKSETKVTTHTHEAWLAYSQAINLTKQLIPLHLQFQINKLDLLIRFQTQLEDFDNVPISQQTLITNIDNLLEISSSSDESDDYSLRINQAAVYRHVHYAESLLRLVDTLGELNQGYDCTKQFVRVLAIDNPNELYCRAAELMRQAVDLAWNQLGDQRSTAYATGRLGALYVQSEQWADAQFLLNRAILLAQHINAPDIGYRWQRQLGILLEAQSQKAEKRKDPVKAQELREESIVAYRAALETLKTVRSDLLPVDSEIQFSFRDEVEPVYREFIDLLTRTSSNSIQTQNAYVAEAIESFDQLQLAEINNFLGCDSGQSIQLERVEDPNAAIIYAITLSDRIAVILDLPNQTGTQKRQRALLPIDTIPRKQLSKSGKEVDLIEEIQDFQLSIEDEFEREQADRLSKELYRQLFSPLESALGSFENIKIDTLVFVLDGDLRNIPLAALRDEQENKYLIEKYSISITPGIELFTPKALPNDLDILLGGTQGEGVIEGISIPSIPKLNDELSQISALARKSRLLIDSSFTSAHLRQSLSDSEYSVVHFKTHGQFSSDPDETYIVGFDELIRGRDFGQLIQAESLRDDSFIDLLTLSACQTAEGDNRAVLGITGIAVRAGARSVVSSVWRAHNLRTIDIMSIFYQELFGDLNLQSTPPRKTRAAALQAAQLSLLNDGAPLKEWAPYVLVGNWQ